MNQNVVVAFIVGLICGVIVWPLGLLKAPGAWEEAQKQVCQLVDDGRWAPNPGACIKRDCYFDGSCGGWAALPASVCGRVEVGDHIAEAFFVMGEPASVVEGSHQWAWGKSDAPGPSAVVRDELIVEFSCKAPKAIQALEEGSDGNLFGNFRLPFSDKRGNIMD